MGKTKDVRAAVEKELGFDPKVDSADVSVRNINGDVIPIGTVPRYPIKRGGPHAAEGCERFVRPVHWRPADHQTWGIDERQPAG